MDGWMEIEVGGCHNYQTHFLVLQVDVSAVKMIMDYCCHLKDKHKTTQDSASLMSENKRGQLVWLCWTTLEFPSNYSLFRCEHIFTCNREESTCAKLLRTHVVLLLLCFLHYIFNLMLTCTPNLFCVLKKIRKLSFRDNKSNLNLKPVTLNNDF